MSALYKNTNKLIDAAIDQLTPEMEHVCLLPSVTFVKITRIVHVVRSEVAVRPGDDPPCPPGSKDLHAGDEPAAPPRRARTRPRSARARPRAKAKREPVPPPTPPGRRRRKE